MNKQNQILAAVLAIQIAILAVVYWPKKPTSEGQPIFEDIASEQIVGLTVRGADEQQIRLARAAGGWVMPEAGDFPVLDDKVRTVLDQIVQVRADRLVTRTRDSHKRLEVADDSYQRLIEFELDDGTQHRLYLGSSPRFRVLHVRADDQDEVYLALGLSVSDVGTGADAWVNPVYFSVLQNQIVAVTLENKNGRFEFAKDESGAWMMLNLPPGETLLENNVSSLLTQVSSLRMTRPLGREEDPSYGFDNPNAKFTLLTRDDEGNEQTHIVRVGASPEGESGFVVKSAASPYYVLMAEFTVDDLMERALQSFIQVPPTPTPAPVEIPTPTP